MPFKDILLHLSPDSRRDVRRDAAIALAGAHDARLTALYTMPHPYIPGFAMHGVPEPVIAEHRDAAEKMAKEVRSAFEKAAEHAGVRAVWHSMEGMREREIVRRAETCDVAIVGQEDPDEPTVAGLTEPLVFGSGRPVITVPYAGKFATIGNRVMVAWDETREASRALHDALPILTGAKQVIVYCVNPVESGPISGDDIAAHLARHGVEVDVHHTVSRIPEDETAVIGRRSLGVGDLLLSAASDFGADLLVMGAYGHSRLREMVLGGATRYVLRHMTVPVLMSH